MVTEITDLPPTVRPVARHAPWPADWVLPRGASVFGAGSNRGSVATMTRYRGNGAVDEVTRSPVEAPPAPTTMTPAISARLFGRRQKDLVAT